MKTALFTLMAFTMLTAFTGDKKFPAASLKTLDGKTVNVQDYIGKGNPVIDDSRGLAKVPGIVTSKSWPFTVLADTKQELQQNLGFQTVPETFLLDGEGNIVYTHSGYNAGDEFELEEKLKELKK